MNNMHKWIQKKRAHLIKEFGGVCALCGKKENLQFAHLTSTSLSGVGRGSKERLYDVLKNPECYTLLCVRCHTLKDGKNPFWDNVLE